MTSGDRAKLKQAVDARVRALLADDDTPRCGGCGCELDCRTIGCERARSAVRRRGVAA